MKREQVLENFKDLVLTLGKSSFHESQVQKLWREKLDKTKEALVLLSVEDERWVADGYEEWHKEIVVPMIDLDIRELFS